jgi:hypothetical protein
MSTVWIVPFLMFFDVTMMVAAVLLAAATTAATTAAISAFLTGNPLVPLSPAPPQHDAHLLRGYNSPRAASRLRGSATTDEQPTEHCEYHSSGDDEANHQRTARRLARSSGTG